MIWANAFIDSDVVEHGILNGLTPLALIIAMSAKKAARTGIVEESWLKTYEESLEIYFQINKKQLTTGSTKKELIDLAIYEVKQYGLWPW